MIFPVFQVLNAQTQLTNTQKFAFKMALSSMSTPPDTVISVGEEISIEVEQFTKTVGGEDIDVLNRFYNLFSESNGLIDTLLFRKAEVELPFQSGITLTSAHLQNAGLVKVFGNAVKFDSGNPPGFEYVDGDTSNVIVVQVVNLEKPTKLKIRLVP